MTRAPETSEVPITYDKVHFKERFLQAVLIDQNKATTARESRGFGSGISSIYNGGPNCFSSSGAEPQSLKKQVAFAVILGRWQQYC
ncbi:Elongation factor Tu [Trichinella spiralis]|uniref:Elongation factor Tu n=1 Tax=Trichinella spiralis TaxID=6334 RepID=A0ABR3KCC9_TRISP